MSVFIIQNDFKNSEMFSQVHHGFSDVIGVVHQVGDESQSGTFSDYQHSGSSRRSSDVGSIALTQTPEPVKAYVDAFKRDLTAVSRRIIEYGQARGVVLQSHEVPGYVATLSQSERDQLWHDVQATLSAAQTNLNTLFAYLQKHSADHGVDVVDLKVFGAAYAYVRDMSRNLGYPLDLRAVPDCVRSYVPFYPPYSPPPVVVPERVIEADLSDSVEIVHNKRDDGVVSEPKSASTTQKTKRESAVQLGFGGGYVLDPDVSFAVSSARISAETAFKTVGSSFLGQVKVEPSAEFGAGALSQFGVDVVDVSDGYRVVQSGVDKFSNSHPAFSYKLGVKAKRTLSAGLNSDKLDGFWSARASVSQIGFGSTKFYSDRDYLIEVQLPMKRAARLVHGENIPVKANLSPKFLVRLQDQISMNEELDTGLLNSGAAYHQLRVAAHVPFARKFYDNGQLTYIGSGFELYLEYRRQNRFTTFGSHADVMFPQSYDGVMSPAHQGLALNRVSQRWMTMLKSPKIQDAFRLGFGLRRDWDKKYFVERDDDGRVVLDDDGVASILPKLDNTGNVAIAKQWIARFNLEAKLKKPEIAISLTSDFSKKPEAKWEYKQDFVNVGFSFPLN